MQEDRKFFRSVLHDRWLFLNQMSKRLQCQLQVLLQDFHSQSSFLKCQLLRGDYMALWPVTPLTEQLGKLRSQLCPTQSGTRGHLWHTLKNKNKKIHAHLQRRGRLLPSPRLCPKALDWIQMLKSKKMETHRGLPISPESPRVQVFLLISEAKETRLPIDTLLGKAAH